MNFEIIITTPADPRLPCVIDAPFPHQQANGDPIFVVVRHDASDLQIARCATRFGIGEASMNKARIRAFTEMTLDRIRHEAS